ncbi:bile acid:sodium symporter family protein [Cellulomonas pakistanensis]|uniref:Bile acid:sodium symporter n=1 Tax=Cellulomonas pakistanensis TaxID=992287 RepID=A0A919U612_9CELL|nr:bile acid:sodium symporter family protein [Cellulomonas pakistanensis]GIG36549.1 bile acid:sodium symporter [Cellulomonas pakistanensis]
MPDAIPPRPGRWSRAWSATKTWVDPLVVMIVAVFLLGLFAPASGAFATGLDHVTTGAVVLLFFLYGARMATSEVWDGLKNWRLQGGMLASTYLLFPVLGLAVQLLPDSVLPDDLKTGLLYLSLLPSTIQSSVVFTSIARGNVAGAITGATVSNVLGIVLTPLLVGILMSRAGGPVGGSAGATLLQLLLPFVLGQLLQPKIGAWIRAHKPITLVTDRGTILLVAYGSVSEAEASGVWDDLTVGVLVVLVAVCALLLAAMLVITWTGGRALRLSRGDRIALLMCGSKKSLATGLPMANVLFGPVAAAGVALPVIVFHQLQLATCAVLARRLAATEPEPDAVVTRA